MKQNEERDSELTEWGNWQKLSGDASITETKRKQMASYHGPTKKNQSVKLKLFKLPIQNALTSLEIAKTPIQQQEELEITNSSYVLKVVKLVNPIENSEAILVTKLLTCTLHDHIILEVNLNTKREIICSKSGKVWMQSLQKAES